MKTTHKLVYFDDVWQIKSTTPENVISSPYLASVSMITRGDCCNHFRYFVGLVFCICKHSTCVHMHIQTHAYWVGMSTSYSLIHINNMLRTKALWPGKTCSFICFNSRGCYTTQYEHFISYSP